MATLTHEAFIHAVQNLAMNQLPVGSPARDQVQAVKLVYGSGPNGTRGVTFFKRWSNGKPEPQPFVEISAFGQENAVQVAGTTLHELAHVIAGWQAGHGPAWKEACETLGLRNAKASDTCYCRAMFTPRLREALAKLGEPTDGKPVPLEGMPQIKLKPCHAGMGVRSGKVVRGKGAGSRLRLWECTCGVKVRIASDDFQAVCLRCDTNFERKK